ncbi:glycosyltransferase [Ectothiorhodospiraceae bacterium WFHF3C12]|nr:glycosyltransferase [Ectothiorhodospiraceae bacterium WFHF3C12]
MSKASMRPLVVYWNNIPSPYMVDRFNALAERADGFDFEVWFNDRIEPDRSWIVDERSWRFRYRYLPVTTLFGRRLHWPAPLLVGPPPALLVSLYAEPVFVFGWLLARLRGARTAFRVLATYDRWVARSRLKDSVKRFLFRRVDAVETPGQDGKRFAERYGVPGDRVFIATHTVDVDHYAGASEAARANRYALRTELGVSGVTFIYVGRLWWGKGLGTLLDAFERVQQAGRTDTSLLLVGDGAEEERLRQTCAERGLHGVVFAGFQQKEQLPRCYAAADVFVFPTLGDPYGLVVDEAMACSLPVISSDAAGEIHDRVVDGENGFVVPAEDIEALAKRMLELADDADSRQRMGRASARQVRTHTPEQWATDFLRIVRDLVPGA